MNPEVEKRFKNASSLSTEYKTQILSILSKFIALSFDASFSKLEEGPVVNTFYFEPALDATLNRIQGKEEDIAISLGVESILIARELGLITIQVPRKKREIIQFHENFFKFIQSKEVSEMTLPLMLGKTPKGEDLYADLSTQPHLLIAGSTNSGKSIFTSQLICSLALAHPPSEMEFILVDTKRLDLVLFAGLPHISDIIEDIHSLRSKLEELLNEVRSRTQKISGMARNIQEWNKLGLFTYKYKILIIDEFADVVDTDREYLSSLKPSIRPISTDSLLKTLAQISRAVGIHIIIATQRPSVKVLSGDIKTNFPARIAFKLASMQDSRVVLDENGAEKLLGMGDYLYKKWLRFSKKSALSVCIYERYSYNHKPSRDAQRTIHKEIGNEIFHNFFSLD
jgi:DNA segregation ATPase FtsK/SpoIIIE, S-DNA-T family